MLLSFALEKESKTKIKELLPLLRKWLLIILYTNSNDKLLRPAWHKTIRDSSYGVTNL